MENYIDRIKLLKSQKKITNEQLASLTGIPLGTLSKLLAGMSDSPKLSNIIAICGALDCSVEYVISGKPENKNNYTLNEEEIALVEDYRKLNVWGKDMVQTVMFTREFRFALLSKIVFGYTVASGENGWDLTFIGFFGASVIATVICFLAMGKEKKMFEERLAAAKAEQK